MKSSPVILAILDGWGLAPAGPSNAVSVARTPHMDRWSTSFPMTSIAAHNGAVGLPQGQMGNSEVGHLNIGAGRVVYQDFTRINMAVESGKLGEMPLLVDLMRRTAASGGRLHFLGLLSDGGVHSHIRHLEALLAMAHDQGLADVFVHCFMDGRDTPPASGLGYMTRLVTTLERCGCGQVATISGRYWAMDRDKRWDRVAKAWAAMVDGRGRLAVDPLAAIDYAYHHEETDEFISPTVLTDGAGVPVGRIIDGDAVLFFNFRADRARELCHAFADRDFDGFTIEHRPRLLELVTMTGYEADFTFPVLFPPMAMTRILGEEVSCAGMRQLRIAETEKYAHVTYFFNGGEEAPYDGEERLLINSPRDVATYDEKPEMSAVEVTDRLLAALDEGIAAGTPFDLVILNFANGDMVGHTGVMTAAVRACETVDQCLGRLYAWVAEHDGVLLVTADHGNAEMMVDPATDQPHTAHTLNPVPFLVLGERFRGRQLREGGALCDIAPTILGLLHLAVPEEMTGKDLFL
ncbi:MAG: phosphoglycerate mutase (2,3-diphosphoglycerate-independent) [Desulfobulbus propionicus]|nr:MAG: phosphoglycerate mutase (2,3-diphosphoglycerate-independent) [Desulfobulbus propionicus]